MVNLNNLSQTLFYIIQNDDTFKAALDAGCVPDEISRLKHCREEQFSGYLSKYYKNNFDAIIIQKFHEICKKIFRNLVENV